MGIACRLGGGRALERSVVRSCLGTVVIGTFLVALSACGSDDVPGGVGDEPEPAADVLVGDEPEPAADVLDETAQSEGQVTDDNDGVGDNDGDGVGDDEDNCPDDHNPDQRDICTDDPGAQGGCPPASMFIFHDDSLDENKRLLVVDAPSCTEAIPHVIPPTRPGSTIVAVVGERTYVLIDEESAGLPAGGVEIEGAVVDMTAPPESGSLAEAELAEVIGLAVSTGDASTVAAALTPEAESFIAPAIWSQVVALNPDLVAGDREVVDDSGGVVAP